MELGVLIIRLFLAVIFSIAAFAKVADLSGSAKAMAGFGVPESLAKPFSISLIIAEIAIAVGLLTSVYSWYAGIGSVVLLVIFTLSMAYHYARGNDQDCHCFGQLVREPVGVASIVRNSALLLLALFLVSRGIRAQGPAITAVGREDLNTILIVAAFGMLVGIAVYARNILLGQTEILKRIDALEHHGFDSVEVSRDEAGSPDDGLPIGAIMPNFALSDAHGEMHTRLSLLAHGKPLLMLFVSPSCAPCKAMVGEFDSWQEELAEKFTVVFASTGKALENLEKFNGSVDKTILIQKKRELSDAMFARWTPAAVVVGSNGRIASRVAAGDVAIRELIEWARGVNLDEPFAHFAKNGGHAGKIGDAVVEFTERAADGTEIDHSFFADNITLVAFWGSGCGHCDRMHDDFAAWAGGLSNGGPKVVVFSDNDAVAEKVKATVIADPDYATARHFGMHGTPSAVLVKDGIIVSETAVGAPNIWALVGRHNVEQ